MTTTKAPQQSKVAARCPNCNGRLTSDFDEDVGMWEECTECDYRNALSSRAPASPAALREQSNASRSVLDEIESALISIADGASPQVAVGQVFAIINNERGKLNAAPAALRDEAELSGLTACGRLSSQEDQPVKNYDDFRAGMLRAAEMARDEFKRAPEAAKGHDCVYMGGYEDACDHLSVAIAQAAVIDSVRIAGSQPDWQYYISLLFPDGIEDQTLLKIYQVVEHELRVTTPPSTLAKTTSEVPEQWITCADCGEKRSTSTLESIETFVCRYCLSTNPKRVPSLSEVIAKEIAFYSNNGQLPPMSTMTAIIERCLAGGGESGQSDAS